MRWPFSPLAAPPMEVVAYLKTMPGSEEPDIKIHLALALYENMGKKIIPQHGFFAHIDILRPESKGEVRLASADPDAAPQGRSPARSRPRRGSTIDSGGSLDGGTPITLARLVHPGSRYTLEGQFQP